VYMTPLIPLAVAGAAADNKFYRVQIIDIKGFIQ
jgi:hypothetical protein